jgi:hypothetical protein
MDDALARTGTGHGQRYALPTTRAFDHMPTAFDHEEIKRNPAAADVARALLLRHRILELAGHRIRHKPAGEMRFNERDNTGSRGRSANLTKPQGQIQAIQGGNSKCSRLVGSCTYQNAARR